jgi:hypothetical protein
MNVLLTVVVILLTLLVIVGVSCCKKTDTFKNKKQNISVYILNYKRPHNIYKILDSVLKYPFVDQVVISHGSPQGFREFKSKNGKSLINIKDYENNEKYGAGRRLMIDFTIFKNDLVLLLDDDILPSEKMLNTLISKASTNPNQLYGPYCRYCSHDGYKHGKFHKTEENSNIVLIGFSLTSISVINNINKHMYKYLPLFEKHKGNGEDLVFNHLFKKLYNTDPICVLGDYKELDTVNGYKDVPNHYKIRDNICTKLNS